MFGNLASFHSAIWQDSILDVERWNTFHGAKRRRRDNDSFVLPFPKKENARISRQGARFILGFVSMRLSKIPRQGVVRRTA